jgi:hypothetical protein
LPPAEDGDILVIVDLIDRIERGLAAGELDPIEFERCAVALLQDLYPGLSAVEGGHDFGRDADIYFTVEGRGGESRIGRYSPPSMIQGRMPEEGSRACATKA